MRALCQVFVADELQIWKSEFEFKFLKVIRATKEIR